MLNVWWKLFFLILFFPVWIIGFVGFVLFKFTVLGWEMAEIYFDLYLIETKDQTE